MKNICCLVLVFIALPTLAIGEKPEEFYEKLNSKNMSGWKGIVFICSYDSSDKLLEQICSRAEKDIKLLAESNNVPLKIADANKFSRASLIATANNFVTLEYELMATQSRGKYHSRAVHARLSFETFFSNAVEKNSRPKLITNSPRAGDLELWSRSVIGTGTPNGIVDPLGNGAETHLKKALTLFLKHRK